METTSRFTELSKTLSINDFPTFWSEHESLDALTLDLNDTFSTSNDYSSPLAQSESPLTTNSFWTTQCAPNLDIAGTQNAQPVFAKLFSKTTLLDATTPSNDINQWIINKISTDTKFITKCFQDMLISLRDKGFLPADEVRESFFSEDIFFGDYLNKNNWTSREIQVFSMAFMLLNMIEENAFVQARRELENSNVPPRGTFADRLNRLSEMQYTEEQFKSALTNIYIEPVLTAHPTEARRGDVIQIIRKLYLLLVERENSRKTIHELDEIRNEILAKLEILWGTGEFYVTKPKLEQERESTLYYLRHIFPQTVKTTFRRLRRTWIEHGFDNNFINDPHNMPHVSFGNWVGGDRDNHPGVTAEFTRETLMMMRQIAIELQHQELTQLAQELTFKTRLTMVPKALSDRLDLYAKQFPEMAEKIANLNPNQPWLQFVLLMQQKLPGQSQPSANHYISATELMQDLALVRTSLIAAGRHHVALGKVFDAEITAKAFGFHLAKTDIRQDSEAHGDAMAEILEAAGVANGKNYNSWTENHKQIFLKEALQSPRLFQTGKKFPQQSSAANVLGYFKVIAEHICKYGSDAFGPLIVSMTKSPSDLLEVYVLAREAGLLQYSEGVHEPLFCPLQVVPLFETVDDLENSTTIMDAFLRHALSRATARQFGGQQIMLGYSDSAKQDGYAAGQFALYKAQEQLNALSKELDVEFFFFHGRGGTDVRGDGPTHYFLDSLAPGTIGSNLRVTEQGQTIAQKYSNLLTATHNLELLIAGTLSNSLQGNNKEGLPDSIKTIISTLNTTQRMAYNNLTEAEGFLDQFQPEATPDIKVFTNFGSRPGKRAEDSSVTTKPLQPKKQTIHDHRAISWSTYWNQSRFLLPLWYGLGSALEQLFKNDREAFGQLKQAIATNPNLKFVYTTIESGLAMADINIMQMYADNVDDPEIRTQFMSQIRNEFNKTKFYFDSLFDEPFQNRRKLLEYTINVRARMLKALHNYQTSQIKSWREKPRGKSTEDEELRYNIQASIVAISHGMRRTG